MKALLIRDLPNNSIIGFSMSLPKRVLFPPAIINATMRIFTTPMQTTQSS
jgi:hypothetical protein